VTYSLDTRMHIAHKSAPFKFEFSDKTGQHFEFKTAVPGGAPGGAAGVSTTTSSVIVTTQAGGPGQAGARVGPPPDAAEFTLRAEGAGTYMFRTRNGSEGKEVTEQLGKQMIEGVEAEGTRSTVTIAAGEIGNDRPIEIVSERWYSPELQLVVMTRHSDPRLGETTYRLTNISRTEQAKSLFEVPVDYTVKEGRPGPQQSPQHQRGYASRTHLNNRSEHRERKAARAVTRAAFRFGLVNSEIGPIRLFGPIDFAPQLFLFFAAADSSFSFRLLHNLLR